MTDEFSHLPRVKANKGKAQWVQARHVRSETNEAERLITHVMSVPYLMPCTTIFVHGVNSEGEWCGGQVNSDTTIGFFTAMFRS